MTPRPLLVVQLEGQSAKLCHTVMVGLAGAEPILGWWGIDGSNGVSPLGQLAGLKIDSAGLVLRADGGGEASATGQIEYCTPVDRAVITKLMAETRFLVALAQKAEERAERGFE